MFVFTLSTSASADSVALFVASAEVSVLFASGTVSAGTVELGSVEADGALPFALSSSDILGGWGPVATRLARGPDGRSSTGRRARDFK